MPIDWCIPWWHDQLAKLATDQRPVTDCPVKRFVPCSPRELRTEAEKTLRLLGAWQNPQPLPLELYSLARNIASESDAKSSPEELVVIGEVTLNESVRRKINPVTLLLANSANEPLYGPADQGRFAATDKDPTVGHILIASFILSGQTSHFARGATAYMRPHKIKDDAKIIAFLGEKFTSGQWAWSGHLPGVDIRRLFALVPAPGDLTIDQMTQNQQGIADLRSGTNPPPPQSLCRAPGEKAPIDWKKIGTLAVVVATGSALAVGTSYAISEFHTKRWKNWESAETAETVEPAPAPPEPAR